MRLSCALIPGPGVGPRARLAERLGYERVFFPDSPALYGDVWIAVAEAGAATTTIGLGTSVIIPSLRHVVATAAAIAHVEAIAPGRLVVAVGTGFTGRAMFGKKALPWSVVATYVRQLKGLLAGEEVVVEGEAARLLHPPGVTTSLPLRTPIVIAANGPKGLAVARELGDGLMCAGVAPEGAEDAAMLAMGTVLGEGEDFRSERVLDAIGAAIAVVYHGTYATAGEAVDGLPGGKGWREEIESFPTASQHLYVHEGHLVAATDRDRRHLAPELGATTFSGTPDQLRERAEEMRATGVSELIYWPLGGDIEGELERMAAVFA